MTENLMTGADALSGPDVDHALTVVAPRGLDDLCGLRVRHNPTRATVEQFMARHTRKGWLEQWPGLSVVGA